MVNKVMGNGVGCLKGLLLCGALFAIGCGGLEPHDSTSLNGKAEVFDEQMASAMMPKVWDVYIHPDGHLLATGVLGRIFIDFEDNGNLGMKVTGPNDEYISMDEEKYIVIGFLDEMKAHMLTEEQLRVNASAIQEAMDIQDGDALRFLATDKDVMMATAVTLVGLGAALILPESIAISIIDAALSSVAYVSLAAAFYFVNVLAGIPDEWRQLMDMDSMRIKMSGIQNERYEYIIQEKKIDGWFRLGKCSQDECEISQADAGM